MKVKVESSGPCRKTLLIEVPAETVKSSYEKVVCMFAAEATVPGYRKGKAPRALVERRFAKSIMDEVRDGVIADSYKAAIAEKEINPVAMLDLSDISLAPGSPMKFKVVLDVPPQFKLPRYKKIALKPNKAEVSDEQVQQSLNALLESRAEYIAVDDRPVARGDLAQLDYDGFCDGKPIEAEGKAGVLGRARDVWIATDRTGFLPGFEEGLVGMKKGDVKEIHATFPPNFRLAAVAGKAAVYRVTLKAVREKKLPEMNNAFLQGIKMESEDALRAALRRALEEQAAHAEKERLKLEIVAYLLKNTTLDLPESLVQEEARVMLSSLIRENIRRGVSKEQFQEKRSELLDTASKSAAERVKLGYILHRIAEEEKIAVEQAEVDRAVQSVAEQWGVERDAARKELEKRKEMDAIRSDILSTKTLDYLLENSGTDEGNLLSRLIKRA